LYRGHVAGRVAVAPTLEPGVSAIDGANDEAMNETPVQ